MLKDINKEQNWIIIISLGILALLAIGFILNFSRSVLIPFVLAIFIYLLVSPLLDFQIIKLKMPRGLAVVLTLLFVMVILILLFLIIGQALSMVFKDAITYRNDFKEFANLFWDKLNNWETLKKMGFDIAKMQSDVNNMINEIDVKTMATETLGPLKSLSSNIIFVSIFLIFLVAGRNSYKVRTGVYGTIDSEIRRYIGLKTVISLITAIAVYIVLRLFGLNLAIVFGLLTFILNFIPNIGSIIATCLPLPVAAIQFQGSPATVAFVVLIPGAIQVTIGNLVEPKIMGKGLKLHPIVILLALSFWGLLWGVTGMFLAVPITATIRIIMSQFETLDPIAKILTGQLPGDSPG